MRVQNNVEGFGWLGAGFRRVSAHLRMPAFGSSLAMT